MQVRIPAQIQDQPSESEPAVGRRRLLLEQADRLAHFFRRVLRKPTELDVACATRLNDESKRVTHARPIAQGTHQRGRTALRAVSRAARLEAAPVDGAASLRAVGRRHREGIRCARACLAARVAGHAPATRRARLNEEGRIIGGKLALSLRRRFSAKSVCHQWRANGLRPAFRNRRRSPQTRRLR